MTVTPDSALEQSAPGGEKGSIADPQNIRSLVAAGPHGWSEYISDVLEHVPELQWKPDGRGMVAVYHKMRSDAQVQGLYYGTTLPVRRYSYHLEPNSSREEIVTKMSRDYNVKIKGQEDQPRGRRKKRFQMEAHLRHVLLAVLYGHMYFEQCGGIGEDGLWHQSKLSPRMPQTLHDIRLAKDGMLASIVQSTRRGSVFRPNSSFVELKVNKLLAYIWEQEGGDWVGRSFLRGIYKNWLLKDRVLRVGAINIERAGGVPVVRAHRGASPQQMTDYATMAQQFKVGEEAGGSIPHDAELMLARAAGGEEAVNYIKLMNEEMGRGWLLMFMNLGQTTSGSRALGGTFVDFALMTQEVMAQWYCDTFTEFQIEDDVDWNYTLSEDETAPFLSYTRTDDRQLAVQDFVAMVEKRIITLSDEDEAWVREEYRMPRRSEDARELPAAPESEAPLQAVAERGARAAGRSPSPLGRPQARADITDLGLDKEVLREALREQAREILGEEQ